MQSTLRCRTYLCLLVIHYEPILLLTLSLFHYYSSLIEILALKSACRLLALLCFMLRIELLYQ